MSADVQGTLRRRNIAENFNRLSRVHQRYRQTTDDRQTTDGRTMTYSERELEFTFAKNWSLCVAVTICATLVNIRTIHTQTDRVLTGYRILLAQPAELKNTFISHYLPVKATKNKWHATHIRHENCIGMLHLNLADIAPKKRLKIPFDINMSVHTILSAKLSYTVLSWTTLPAVIIHCAKYRVKR